MVFAAALPRLLALVHERGPILAAVRRQERRFATTLVDHGTFGFLPGVPSAYTQPLYGWFLIGRLPPVRPLLGLGRNRTDRRRRRDGARRPRDRLAAPLPRRRPCGGSHHDAAPVRHLARRPHEPRAARRARARGGDALRARCAERALLWLAALAGIALGLAILGNARLRSFPSRSRSTSAASRFGHALPRLRSSSRLTALVLTPWVVRNDVQVGCSALTTDARALWKANNPETHGVLDARRLDRRRPAATRARRHARSTRADLPSPAGRPSRRVRADAALPARGTSTSGASILARSYGSRCRRRGCCGSRCRSRRTRPGADIAGHARSVVEPMFMIVLYAFALVGVFVLPRASSCSRSILLAYQTRSPRCSSPAHALPRPWDFLLAILAAFALASAWDAAQRRRRRPTSAPPRALAGRGPRSTRRTARA